MKHTFTISSLIFLFLIGCKDSQRPSDKTNETPKALQDKNSSVAILSKRSYNDMVEDLYNELADKTPELKDIETRIAKIWGSKDDSTASFDEYDQKIQSYFNSASAHILQIKDSSLNEKMRLLIWNSLADYNLKISAHSKLLSEITVGTATLGDLHTILKIISTLPLIIKYENDNKPSTYPLQGFKNEMDKTIKLVDSLVKK